MKSPKPTSAEIAPGAVIVGGAPEGFDARLVADLVGKAGGPVIHVARDDARAAAMAEALAVFAPSLPVLQFPAWDCLPYDRVSPNPEIAAARMATLAALADGFDRPAVVLTTLNAATQKVPARAVVAGATFAHASQPTNWAIGLQEAASPVMERVTSFNDLVFIVSIVITVFVLALRQAGLPNRALAEFRRVQRSHGDYLDAAVQAGLTLYTLGRADDARREWQGVLQQDPEHREAQMYLRLVR